MASWDQGSERVRYLWVARARAYRAACRSSSRRGTNRRWRTCRCPPRRAETCPHTCRRTSSARRIARPQPPWRTHHRPPVNRRPPLLRRGRAVGPCATSRGARAHRPIASDRIPRAARSESHRRTAHRRYTSRCPHPRASLATTRHQSLGHPPVVRCCGQRTRGACGTQGRRLVVVCSDVATLSCERATGS